MVIKNNSQKKKIDQKMIKANIYDDIKLYVDICGVIDEDFNCINSEVSKLFQKEEYSRYEDGLSETDFHAWNERTEGIISPSRLKSLLNNEKKVIYASNEGTEKVILTKLFICVKSDIKSLLKIKPKIPGDISPGIFAGKTIFDKYFFSVIIYSFPLSDQCP